MPKSRPPYPAEYRAELVRLVREEGRSPTDFDREFEPSAQSISNWVAQADIDTGRRDGLTTDEKAELKRLRSENRVLRMEKDLLERAASSAAKNTPSRGRCSSSSRRRRPTSRSSSGETASASPAKVLRVAHTSSLQSARR